MRTLTHGRHSPTTHSPTLSMVAFKPLLEQGQMDDGWLWVDAPCEPHARAAHMHAICCEGWTKKAAVIGIKGTTSSAIAWIFHDRSVLLTEQRGGRLRIYPGVVWLLSRECGWKPTVLIGKNNGGPSLRVHHAHTKTNEVLLPHQALDSTFTDSGGSFLARVRADVDRLAGVFSTLPGPAVPPSATTPTLWPSFLARKSTTPQQDTTNHTLLEDVSTWLGPFLHSLGTPSARVTTTRGGQAIYVSIEEHVMGVCPLAKITPAIAERLFPPALLARVQGMMATPQGFFHALPTSSPPRYQQWPKQEVAATPAPTHHAMLRVLSKLSQWGPTPCAAAAAWEEACAPESFKK